MSTKIQLDYLIISCAHVHKLLTYAKYGKVFGNLGEKWQNNRFMYVNKLVCDWHWGQNCDLKWIVNGQLYVSVTKKNIIKSTTFNFRLVWRFFENFVSHKIRIASKITWGNESDGKWFVYMSFKWDSINLTLFFFFHIHIQLRRHTHISIHKWLYNHHYNDNSYHFVGAINSISAKIFANETIVILCI